MLNVARVLLLAFLVSGVGQQANAQSPGPVRKPIVAVQRINDPTNSGQADTLKTMIQTAVVGTGKFRTIERDFGQLDTEQALARSGRTTTNRPARSGGYEGADFIIYGTITTASRDRQGDSGAEIGRAMVGQFLGVNMGGGNCNKAMASFAVDVKIVDTVTGEVKFAHPLTSRSVSSTTCSGDASIDLVPVLRDIANQTAMGLTITMYPIKVAAVQADGVFILNYGEGALSVGTVLGVYGQGAAIIDPDTGAVLTSEGAELGRIQVTEVTTRFSKAVPLSPFASAPPTGAVARVLADQSGSKKKGRRG